MGRTEAEVPARVEKNTPVYEAARSVFERMLREQQLSLQDIIRSRQLSLGWQLRGLTDPTTRSEGESPLYEVELFLSGRDARDVFHSHGLSSDHGEEGEVVIRRQGKLGTMGGVLYINQIQKVGGVEKIYSIVFTCNKAGVACERPDPHHNQHLRRKGEVLLQSAAYALQTT